MSQQYNINVKSGHYWKGAQIQILVNGTPFDLTGATMKMWIVATEGATTPLLELSTANSKLEITNAATGTFKIKPQTFNLPEGKYPYDILITIGSDTYNDYVQGYVIVKPRITQANG